MKWPLCLILLGAINGSLVADLWQFDFQDAVDRAVQQDRLLVVVQIDADFLETANNNSAFRNYLFHAVDDKVSTWLGEHAVPIALNVGPPAYLQVDESRNRKGNRKAPPAATGNPVAGEEPSIGNCITWICQPDGTVLFCLPGYPDPDLLIGRLAWADALYREGVKDRERLVAGQLSQVEPEDQEFFLSMLGKRPKKTGSFHRKKWVNHAVQTVARARRQRIEHRFGANWGPQKLDAFTRSLGTFAVFENQFMHCLFATLPDIKIGEIQRTVWREIGNTRIWNSNRQELVDWLQLQQQEKKPILLRIVGETTAKRNWPPARPVELVRLLDKFAVRKASLDDVALMASHLNTEPLLIPPAGTPTYFVTTTKGDQRHLLTNRNSNRELADALLPVYEQEDYRR